MSIGELPLNIKDILDRLNQLNDLFNYLQNRLDILNAELVNLSARFNNVEYRLDVVENSITNINNRVDNLTGRMNSAETNISNLYTYANNLSSGLQGLNQSVNDLWDELANYLRKATPIPGYNPYHVDGDVSADVWMYNITPIDDNNIRFYYVQFNYITGNLAKSTNWVPLPRTFGNFMYTLHPEFFPLPPGPDIPFTVSGRGGTSYTLQISSNEDSFRLWYKAGPANISGDYIGFLLIGNASSPGPLDEENIEKIPVEDLRKMVRKLQLQVNQLNKSDEKK
jgi:prefoldin subunit 5